VYGLLLVFLPADFRRAYGSEMRALFEERLRAAESARGRARTWAYALADLISVAVAERLPRSGTRGAAMAQRPDTGGALTRRLHAALDGSARDLRHAVHVLLRGGPFSAVAVLTLALGIGANTAIFSLVNGLLLRPLPYPEAERLIWIATPMVTPENLSEWREGMRSLERMAAFDVHSVVITGHGPAERLGGMIVTDEFLPLLGAVPVRGRLWTADEQRVGATPTVVVSQALWERVAAISGEVGQTGLTLDGAIYTVIGVLPATFEDLHYDSDVWFPAGASAGRRFNIIGLRRPGASIAAVQAEATALAERVDVPGTAPRRRFANIQTLAQVYKGDIRTPLLVLFAAAGFVLLIACVNVTNLLLTRAAGREREMAVRSALGAGRATLLRQLLMESAVLALAGALVGWFVATAGLRAVLVLVPDFYGFGRIGGVRMDHAVLAFTALVAFATTLLAGLAPAIHAAQHAGRVAAGSTRVSATRRVRRWREALMAAEVALALVLLIGTVLLIRTFLVLRPASPGFEARDRMVARIQLPAVPERDEASKVEFARRVLRDVQTAAPAARVALATDVPLSGIIMNFPVLEVDGRPYVPADDRAAGVDLVSASPNYFDVLGISVVRGRGLTPSDLPGSAGVVVLNESAANRFWPDADPIGRHIVLDFGERSVELGVVGVAADTRSSGIHTRARTTAFVSFWQVPWGRFELVVHQPAEARLSADAVRRIVASIDAGIPVPTITTLEQMTAQAVAEPRYHMVLMLVFGALAVVLAVVGCYGVLSYSVAQRTREIGIRVALGASRATIVRRLVARGALLVAIGLIAGTAMALALTRVLESRLYGVTPFDPATFAGAAAGLALVSLAAAYLPARRAAAVEPTEALRAE
jgi:putative ABC transport system permease protein